MKKQKRILILMVVTVMIFSIGLTGCGGNGGNGGTGGADNGAGEVIRWTFFSGYGPTDGAVSVVLPRLFNEIYEATDGRLSISIMWSGQHPYEGEDLLRAIEVGATELAHFFSGYLVSVEPIFSADSIPLMLPGDVMEAWDIIKGLWGDFELSGTGFYEQILNDRWNASLIHMIPASPQRFFSIGYDVPYHNSLEGRMVRVFNADLARLVTAMGGTPVPIAFAEVYTSLATGLIDGLVTSTAFAYSGGFFDYVDTINKWEISLASDGVAVCNDALASLPADIREIFLGIMLGSARAPEMLEIEDNNQLVERLVAEEGKRVVIPTEAERERVRQLAVDYVWAPWLEATGEEGHRLLDEIDRLIQR